MFYSLYNKKMNCATKNYIVFLLRFCRIQRKTKINLRCANSSKLLFQIMLDNFDISYILLFLLILNQFTNLI